MTLVCTKCKDASRRVILRLPPRNETCGNCLREFVQRRFKTALRNAAQMRRGRRCLFAVSGGAHSMLMAAMAAESRSTRARKRMFFSAAVCHVNCGNVLPFSDRVATLDQGTLAQTLPSEDFDLGVHTVCVCTGLLDATYVPVDSIEDECKCDQLQQLLDNARRSSPSLADDVLRFFVMRALCRFALRMQCETLLLGTSSDRAACDALQAVLKKRGFAAPQYVSPFECIAHADIVAEEHENRVLRVARPLLNVSTKYATLLCRHLQLSTFVSPAFCTMLPAARAGVNRVAESFLAQMRHAFPAASANVLRCVAKLQSPADAAAFVAAGMQPGMAMAAPPAWLEERASETEFSSVVREVFPALFSQNDDSEPLVYSRCRLCRDTVSPCALGPKAGSQAMYASLALDKVALCDACIQIINIVGEDSLWPRDVVEQVALLSPVTGKSGVLTGERRQKDRRRLRDEIACFLLDESI